MIRCIKASVSGSTELVASSNNKTRLLRAKARMRATKHVVSKQLRAYGFERYSRSCRSPALKFAPSLCTSPSRRNFSLMLGEVEGLFCTRSSTCCNCASEHAPEGSMFSLEQVLARPSSCTYVERSSLDCAAKEEGILRDDGQPLAKLNGR